MLTLYHKAFPGYYCNDFNMDHLFFVVFPVGIVILKSFFNFAKCFKLLVYIISLNK